MTQAAISYKLGAIAGKFDLGAKVALSAARFAAAHYAAEKAAEFSGENVETFAHPIWVPKRDTWLPVAELAALGYRAKPIGSGEEMVVTLGVDMHVDDAFGMNLCLVLHNDALTFRTGKVSHKPVAGQWFLFDDRIKHGVKEAKGAAVFVALTQPLEKLA